MFDEVRHHMFALHSRFMEHLDAGADRGQVIIPIPFISPGRLTYRHAAWLYQAIIHRREADKQPPVTPFLSSFVLGGRNELISLIGSVAKGNRPGDMIPGLHPGIEVLTEQRHRRIHAYKGLTELLEDG